MNHLEKRIKDICSSFDPRLALKLRVMAQLFIDEEITAALEKQEEILRISESDKMLAAINELKFEIFHAKERALDTLGSYEASF